MKHWSVYLSGEIHSNWRKEIIDGAAKLNLPISFYSAVTDHDASDAAGDVLGSTDNSFWRDNQSAKVNAIRISSLIKQCDIAVIRFGEKYKQWNAAFDAGYCAALGKPYITLHNDDIIHPLKEVNAAAIARASTTEQVIDVLRYTVKG